MVEGSVCSLCFDQAYSCVRNTLENRKTIVLGYKIEHTKEIKTEENIRDH